MDHLMAEKLTKIIKTAKWGKSHQKNIKKKRLYLIFFKFLQVKNQANQLNMQIKFNSIQFNYLLQILKLHMVLFTLEMNIHTV